MWYTRQLYAAMKASTIVPTDSKRKKETTYIKLSSQIKEEFAMWIYLFQSNKGSPWRTYDTILVEADISSDASGRQFAGIADFQQGPTLITAGNFEEHILEQDIQVKEGVALKQTLLMLLQQAPEKIKSKTLIVKLTIWWSKKRYFCKSYFNKRWERNILDPTSRRFSHASILCFFTRK